MKKHFLPLLLALLLCFGSVGAAARADNTMIVNLGTAEAGAYADRLLATTERGSAAVSDGTLPDGCQIVTEDRDGSAYHYLRGTPMSAGSFAFTLSVSAPSGENESELVAELQCSLSVVPAAPSLTVSPDVSCNVGEGTILSVSATAADGGALSYQWYSSASRSNQDGSLLSGETGATLSLIPSAAGTMYYYCVVTNTNNGQTAAVSSPVIAVTASEVKPLSLAVLTMPAKLDYTVGERLDTTGLQLRQAFSDGHSETIGAGYTAEPTYLGTIGTQTITIRYGVFTCSFQVQVKEEEEVVLDLQVIDLPKKLDYTVGEWFDSTGMTLRVDTNKGSYDVSTGYSCSPRTLEQEGRQTITVNYGSHSVTFTVNVAAAEKRVESIAVMRRPAKLSYTVGDSFDPLGLTLTVTTNQGAEEISEGFTWAPQQFTYAGRQNVTISYEGKTCQLELIVDAPEETPAPAESAAPTPEVQPETTPAVTPRPDTRVERKSGQTAVTVIVIAALVGLAALLGYGYLAKREKLSALLQSWKERFGKK